MSQNNTLQIDQKVRFDHKSTSWRVRANTSDRRYSLCTCSMFGNVYYTIIDHEEGIRGAMNIIGGGLSIMTTQGPDKEIDHAIDMLDETLKEKAKLKKEHPEMGFGGGWDVSHRNRVDLNITSITVPA